MKKVKLNYIQQPPFCTIKKCEVMIKLNIKTCRNILQMKILVFFNYGLFLLFFGPFFVVCKPVFLFFLLLFLYSKGVVQQVVSLSCSLLQIKLIIKNLINFPNQNYQDSQKGIYVFFSLPCFIWEFGDIYITVWL